MEAELVLRTDHLMWAVPDLDAGIGGGRGNRGKPGIGRQLRHGESRGTDARSKMLEHAACKRVVGLVCAPRPASAAGWLRAPSRQLTMPVTWKSSRLIRPSSAPARRARNSNNCTRRGCARGRSGPPLPTRLQCTLAGLRVALPHGHALADWFATMAGVNAVASADVALSATLVTPNGTVELR